MQETWQAYVELLTGATEATRKRAQDVATRLVGSGVATAAQLHGLTEELMANGAANRSALLRTVRTEIDRALDRVGLARADQVDELSARVDALSASVAAVAGAAPDRPVKKAAATNAPPTKKAPAKKAPAKKVAAKKVAAKKAPAKHSPQPGPAEKP